MNLIFEMDVAEDRNGLLGSGPRNTVMVFNASLTVTFNTRHGLRSPRIFA
jgi:hypothetical protein